MPELRDAYRNIIEKLDSDLKQIDRAKEAVQCEDSNTAKGDKEEAGRRRLQVPAEAAPQNEQQWMDAWQESLVCWWLALPHPTKRQIGACTGAFALHIASNLEASWNSALAILGRAPVSAAPPPDGIVEDGCGWVADSIALPDFPDFSGTQMRDMPPIPRLLPPRMQPQWYRSQARARAAAAIAARARRAVDGGVSSSGGSSGAATSDIGMAAMTGGVVGLVMGAAVGTVLLARSRGNQAAARDAARKRVASRRAALACTESLPQHADSRPRHADGASATLATPVMTVEGKPVESLGMVTK